MKEVEDRSEWEERQSIDLSSGSMFMVIEEKN